MPCGMRGATYPSRMFPMPAQDAKDFIEVILRAVVFGLTLPLVVVSHIAAVSSRESVGIDSDFMSLSIALRSAQ